MTIYLMCFLLLVMGLYCLVAKKHLIKKIIGLVILDYAINLFIVLIGYRPSGTRPGGLPPILFPDMNPAQFSREAVDPLPQALVLTSIVIGLGVLFMLVSLAIRIYEKYKTLDTSEISKLKG